MRLIGDEGEQVGVVPLFKALQLARERGLDLVEVAPNAVPPVCRILDYGKFRYEQAKKERDSHKGQRTSQVREVRFRTKIGAFDMNNKARVIQKLLADGDKVKVSVIFRGREITHPEIGANILKKVAEYLKDDAKLEKPPAMEGRNLSMILAAAPHKKAPQPQPKGEVTSGKVQAQKVQAQDA